MYERLSFQKCFEAAKALGVLVFAVKDGGKCLYQELTEDPTLYQDNGPSSACLNGEGAVNAMNVYTMDPGQCPCHEVTGWFRYMDRKHNCIRYI